MTNYDGDERRREDNMLSRLVSIEAKVDAVLTGQGDHESRIRSLERGWWKASGAAAVIGAVAASLFKWKTGG